MHSINFFITDYLDGFDLTLGRSGLKIIEAKIDFFSLELIYKNKVERIGGICSNKSIQNKNEKSVVKRKNSKEKNMKIEKPIFEKENVLRVNNILFIPCC